MRCFSLSFDKVIIRFYLMMGCILIAGFTGYYFLAILALPIFLSTILGVSFSKPTFATKPARQRKPAPTASTTRVAV